MSQDQSIAPAAASAPESSSAETNAVQSAEGSAASGTVLGLTPWAWAKIGIITALFAGLFWPNLRRLWDKTNPFTGEANWGHAMCVPLVGLYYLYVNREQLLSKAEPLRTTPGKRGVRVWVMLLLMLGLPLAIVHEVFTNQFSTVTIAAGIVALVGLGCCTVGRKSPLLSQADEHSAGWFGGFVLVFGILLFAYGIYPGQNDFVKDFGMVVALFGVVLMLSGWHVMNTAWFPIAFLVCAIPWPGLMYSKIAWPLQQLAARVAVWTLEMTRVESSANGTKISILGYGGTVRTLNVAEACAGLRSLMTFVSVGAAVAFLSARPIWQKIIISIASIPIAIFCNVMRISGQGLLDHYVSQQLSENFAHQFVGMIMLIPAFLLILLVGWVLDQIFLEEVDRKYIAEAPGVIRRAGGAAPLAAVPAPRHSVIQRRGPAPIRIPPSAPKPAIAPQVMTAPRPVPTNPAAPRPTQPRPANLPPPPSVRLANRKPTQPKPPSPEAQ